MHPAREDLLRLADRVLAANKSVADVGELLKQCIDQKKKDHDEKKAKEEAAKEAAKAAKQRTLPFSQEARVNDDVYKASWAQPKLSVAELERLRASRVRVAGCVCGMARGLTDPQLQQHFRRVHAPLLDSPLVRLSIFAHLGVDYLSEFGTSEAALASAASAINATLLRLYSPTGAVESLRLLNRSLDQPGKGCAHLSPKTGYAMWLKVHACSLDIQAVETLSGVRYDFVWRTRPDFEYGATLPPDREWLRLRRDLFLATLAFPYDPKKKQPNPRPEPPRLGWRVVMRGGVNGSREHHGPFFLDDNAAVFPRDHAISTRYFGMAWAMAHCIRPESRQAVCGKETVEWFSPECTVQHMTVAFSGPPGIYVGELPWTQKFAWIDCRFNNSTGSCGGQRRVRFAWETPPCELLACKLGQSHFAPLSHLVEQSRAV